MDFAHVRPGCYDDAHLLRLPEILRENLEATTMIYVTAVVCVFLFVYLTVALIRPEWF